MAVLKDNRKYQGMSVAQADDLFLQIARLKAVIDKENAAHKKHLADLEISHKSKLDPVAAEKAALEKELAAYILANPERFAKPRKHPVGQIGTYGITTDPAYIEVTDQELLFEFAMLNGYDDLMQVVRTVDKTAAMRRLNDGEDVPGVRLIPAGDVAKIAFKKGYAEALHD